MVCLVCQLAQSRSIFQIISISVKGFSGKSFLWRVCGIKEELWLKPFLLLSASRCSSFLRFFFCLSSLQSLHFLSQNLLLASFWHFDTDFKQLLTTALPPTHASWFIRILSSFHCCVCVFRPIAPFFLLICFSFHFLRVNCSRVKFCVRNTWGNRPFSFASVWLWPASEYSAR